MKNLPLIAFYLLILLASGCGSKKKLSSRELERISTVEKKDVVQTVTVLSNARILTDSIGKRVTYEPIDPGKPSRVGYTEFQNARITHEDAQVKKNTETFNKDSSYLKDNSETKTKEVKRSRKTNVKDSRIPWWTSFAVAGVAVLIFLIWVRFGIKKKSL